MPEKYIKAADCEKYFYEHLDDVHIAGAMNAIDEMPAADVAEVVRCKDCDNFEDIICGWCRYFEKPITLNDYCSCGERIDSDNG